MTAEYDSTNGENFYSPSTPTEQTVEAERQMKLTIAALPFLEEQIAYFEHRLSEAGSIHNITLGKGVKTDVQILANQKHAKDCEEVLERLRAQVLSVQPQEAVS